MSVSNLLSVYETATEEQYQCGRQWYANARIIVEEIASPFNLQVERVAGALAALSPVISWEKCVEYTKRLVVAYEQRSMTAALMVPTLKRPIFAAWQLMDGASPDDILKGPKVSAFYQSIIAGGNCDAVTVDRHAIGAWMGAKRRDSDATPHLKLYRRIQEDYREASLQTDDTPANFQAIVWVVWKEKHGGRK